MKEKTKIRIVALLLGLLIPAVVIWFWHREANRIPRLEAQAEEAMRNGNWDQAIALAEETGNDELRMEAVYHSAEQLYDSGDYAGAEQIFSSLGAYRDAATRVLACRYAAADALERAGDDDAAYDAFYALVPYADAMDRCRAIRYRSAERLLQSGDSYAAFSAFEALIPYADSEARATEIAVSLTGETDPKKAIAFAKGYSSEEWDHIEQIAASRSALTHGRIAVGNAHAVVLFSDGHAEAAGDNSHGQCNMADFRSLQAVAAGYDHTLGLRTDGTVVAAGDNSCGQCEVSDWTDVASIVCGAWDSFGIRTDGTLLHCGFSTYDLSGWTNLHFICACETALIGISRDGTLLCTAAYGRDPGSYCDAAITTGSAFMLTEEGTVQSASAALDAWKDVAAISNSATVLIGICTDGTLFVHPLIPCDAAYTDALQKEQNVSEAALGASFALILHRDGTLTGCGTLPPAIAAFLEHTPSL